ncbi:MAG TPA: hypothetical protein DCF68_08700 [Cyanothece sp. UBA12306]|nr:hypothetical protein [Cyanothece sp. UBA12306]
MKPKTEEFIKLIDKAIDISQDMLSMKSHNSERLNQLITILKNIKNDAIDGTLESSKGSINLGLSRNTSDWIEPLDSPLLNAVGEIEKYYQKNL